MRPPIVVSGHPGYRLDYRWSGTVRYGIGGLSSDGVTWRTASVHVLRTDHPVSVRCIAAADAFASTWQAAFDRALTGLKLFEPHARDVYQRARAHQRASSDIISRELTKAPRPMPTQVPRMRPRNRGSRRR